MDKTARLSSTPRATLPSMLNQAPTTIVEH